MAFAYCGVVDSEDGLLLLGDPTTLQLWRGTEDEQTQQDRIEAMFEKGQPGLTIPLGHGGGVIWDIDGPGSTDIFRDEATGNLKLVRCWLAGDDDMEVVFALSNAPTELGKPFAEFEIKTGFVVIMWPTEPGSSIRSVDGGGYSLAVEEMMTDTCGMILPLPNGRYQCFHDEVETEQGEARRCHVISIT